MISKRMTGACWHIGYSEPSGDRRHKAKCIYYDRGHCLFQCISCVGSSHCDCYRTTNTVVDKEKIYENRILSKKIAQRLKKRI